MSKTYLAASVVERVAQESTSMLCQYFISCIIAHAVCMGNDKCCTS